MIEYTSEPPDPAEPEKVGVLLANLGTPDAPTAEALRPYLGQFLSDPRVIELPPWRWLPILHGVILLRRPAASAKLYQKVWTDEGSPLLTITERQTEAVARLLADEVGRDVVVTFGMRIGTPNIADRLRELRARGVTRVLVVPLFPQYSGTTTGSVWDAIAEELTTWRRVPSLRFVDHYHDEPGYVSALAATVEETWDAHGRPDKLVASFHGLPRRYFEAGDPYYWQCLETGHLLQERLGLDDDAFEVTFQSLFGREEWIKPYTDKTLEAMARSGVEHVQVVAPGFSADCLETLEELDQLNRSIFLDAGGKEFHYVPALNDRLDHVRFLADLAERHLTGWLDRPDDKVLASRRRRAEEHLRDWPPPEDAGYGATTQGRDGQPPG